MRRRERRTDRSAARASLPAVSRWSAPDLWIYVTLAVAVLAVYGQVRGFDFVNYDDPDYVTENPVVLAGLTWKGFVWTFTSGFAGNWFPLTWLSHMTDIRLFGLDSGAHHMTSVLLHLASAALLFTALRRMTGARWQSAFVAMVFALHPLHVESVAWISERKDVLSGFFWFLSLWCYGRYAERPGAGRYVLVLIPFILGLMAKQMIVTLPLVLLVLDVWPLQRASRGYAFLVREKVPFFALSVAASVVAFTAQRSGGAVISLDSLPVAFHVQNALISWAGYIVGAFWPARLAPFYPLPLAISSWKAALAALVLAGISFGAWRTRGSHPWLAAGWLWYLVTLLPVIGLIQVGAQSHADRYTYIPMVGLSIAVAWGTADIANRWRRMQPALVALGAAACIGCAALTWFQVQYWRNSVSLFSHAIEVSPGNYLAYNNLGVALRKQGRMDEAIADFRKSISIAHRFDQADAHNNLGEALLIKGKTDEALPELDAAVSIRPGFPAARINLGLAYDKLGRAADSIAQYREAVRLEPGNAKALGGLGMALADAGRTGEGLARLREAVNLQPDDAGLHFNLGRILGGTGHPAEAAAEFSAAIRLNPADAESHYNLGTALGAQGRLSEAINEFTAALRLKPDYPSAQFNLGSALAQSGRINEAIAHFAEALRLDPGFEQARQSLERARALQLQ